MRLSGKTKIPLILVYVLLIYFAPAGASEAVFYSIPEDKANANLNDRLQQEIPNRQIIFLNGEWELQDAASGRILGNVNVPCTFQLSQKLIFKKTFNLSGKPGQDYLLHLGEINGRVSLHLNDSLLYKNTRNYLPVTLVLPINILKDGENTLRLQIKSENRRFANAPAFSPINLPRADTGILSGIYLEVRPKLFIKEINVTSSIADSTATVSGKIMFNDFILPGVKYNVKIAYASSEKSFLIRDIPVRQQALKEIDLPEWPKENTSPWSMETPNRYWIEVTLDSAGQVVDRLRQPLVMRSIKSDQTSYWLNGRKIVINGINYIYQNKEGSQLFDLDLVRQDLAVIKQRGFNAVRVILNPLPEQFYQLCDEIGLLCFQDLPLMLWSQNKPENQISARWAAYLQRSEDLARRYNSIAGIGAAFYPNGASSYQRRQLNELVKTLKSISIPLYVSTFLPEPQLASLVDFQIVEILHRNQLGANLQRVDKALEGGLYFPSAYSKAMTYRVDSTIITHDLQQVYEFYEKLTQNALPTEVEGNFVSTYNDFYLQLPSLQNGMEKDFFLNRIGQVDIKRISRSAFDQSGESGSGETFNMVYEDKATHSFLYIIIGFLNIFVFLITYRRYRIFRQNLGYSVKKPHGFFVSLSERIIIPYKQSFFLMLVISVNGAIIYSSIAYFYRNHLLFDYILSLFYYTPELKSFIVKIVWDQALFLVIVTVKLIIIFYGFAFLIKLTSWITGKRVLFNQALAVSIWAASPFIILLPLGILMYNLLLMMKSYWIIWGVLLYFHVWCYFRWINGIRVLMDRLYSRVFIGITLVFISVEAAFIYIYEER